jgi:cbb3-type cytochrome oxidase subunit 3
MDIHLIRGFCTILMLVAFSILIIWAFSKKQRKEFSQAEILPFTNQSVESYNQDATIKQNKLKPSAKGATSE